MARPAQARERGHDDGCRNPQAQGLSGHHGRSHADRSHGVVDVLAEHRIGAVLVIDRAEQLLGIVSERDIVRCLAANGARTLEMTAGQLMTRALQVAHPETTVAEAMAMMTVGRFRHMPVMERDTLVGLISIGDVVKARIMEQEDEVDSLKAYVAGSALTPALASVTLYRAFIPACDDVRSRRRRSVAITDRREIEFDLQAVQTGARMVAAFGAGVRPAAADPAGRAVQSGRRHGRGDLWRPDLDAGVHAARRGAGRDPDLVLQSRRHADAARPQTRRCGSSATTSSWCSRCACRARRRRSYRRATIARVPGSRARLGLDRGGALTRPLPRLTAAIHSAGGRAGGGHDQPDRAADRRAHPVRRRPRIRRRRRL